MREGIALLVVLATSALAARPAPAQTSPEPKRVCFRGRPAAYCRAFWLTEAGYYWRLGGSDFVEQFTGASFEREHLSTHVTWELGGMVNRGRSTALGATVLFGMDAVGTRRGVKGRYRRWLDDGEATLDVSAGIVNAGSAAPHPDLTLQAYGATVDVSVGWRDLFAGTVRAETLLREDGRTVTAAYAGLRLGSYPAVAATTTAAVVIAVALALILGGGDF